MRTLTVGAVMTRELSTVTPDTEFKDIAALLTREAISAVPVVDDQGTLQGVVSEADLLPKRNTSVPRTGRPGSPGNRQRRRTLCRRAT